MPKKREEEDKTPVEKPDDLVSALVQQFNKQSKSAAFSLYDGNDPSLIEDWIPTGSTLLDYAITNRKGGGIPYGRITEINGLESTGKSLLALKIIANAQKKGGLGVLLDTEQRRLEKDFLIRLGVNPKKFLSLYPNSLEEAFEFIEATIKNVRKDDRKRQIVVVWDSLSASPPQAEVEGSYDPQSQIGLGAKAVGRGIRKLTGVIGTENIALVIINQLRYNPMAMRYADPYVTPYGKAVPFAASVRLRVEQSTKIVDKDDEVIGYNCRVKVLKNSLGPPKRSISFPLYHGYGPDDKQSLYDFLKSKGIIKKSGSGPAKLKWKDQEFDFPSAKWKSFLAEHQELVMDAVDNFMVKKYEVDTEKDMEIVYDENDTASEV